MASYEGGGRQRGFMCTALRPEMMLGDGERQDGVRGS